MFLHSTNEYRLGAYVIAVVIQTALVMDMVSAYQHISALALSVAFITMLMVNKAVLPMLVGQHLKNRADEISLRVKALLSVGMQHRFLQSADKLPLRLSGAKLAMLMARVLLHGADKLACAEAVPAMGMALCFLKLADQLFAIEAAITVTVAFAFLQSAHKLSDAVAVACVSMAALTLLQAADIRVMHFIALIAMDMLRSVFQSADKIAIGIKAIQIMVMGHIIRLTADKLSIGAETFGHMYMICKSAVKSLSQVNGRAKPTGLIMAVLRQSTNGFPLHGNGRQYQSVGRYEHDQGSHGADSLLPAFFSSARNIQFNGFAEYFPFH